MKNLDELTTEANALLLAAKSGDLTAEQRERLAAITPEIKAAQALAADIAAGEQLLAHVKSAGPAPVETVDAPKSLGEHFVKSVADGLPAFKSNKAAGLVAPEYKAAGDPTVVGASQFNDTDRSVASQTRRQLSVIDLFSQGNVSGNGLVYFVEMPVQGSVDAVAEGDAAAKVTYTYEQRREGISKLSGLTKLSDEMLDDADFIASEINGNLVTDLGIETESQLLSGDGIGVNIKGVLNRDGVLTEAAANVEDNADAIHRAATKVSIASGRQADAIVLNPLDYERERLRKDNTGAYMAGGPLSGANADVVTIWGRRAVVTTAIAQGTVLVGAFATASLLAKGGITVKSTESNATDFEEGLVSLKAERRVGLKVPKPAAFCVVTLSAAAAA